jgi:hypothetical protein
MDEIARLCEEDGLGEIFYAEIFKSVDASLQSYRSLMEDVRDKFKNSKFCEKWAEHYFYYQTRTVSEWIEMVPILMGCKKNLKVST